MNVASTTSVNVMPVSAIAHPLKLSRRRYSVMLWMSATPVSHGSSDAFSTGSHAQ